MVNEMEQVKKNVCNCYFIFTGMLLFFSFRKEIYKIITSNNFEILALYLRFFFLCCAIDTMDKHNGY